MKKMTVIFIFLNLISTSTANYTVTFLCRTILTTFLDKNLSKNGFGICLTFLEAVKNALKKLHDAANQYDKISSNLTDRSNEINQLLFTSERLMTRKEGLPGRDWYKHHIYAPGFYTGYGVKTIPGVREAIEQGNYTLLEEQIDVAADVINGISDRIHSIVSIMGK